MSMTVFQAFSDKASNGEGKLPAAQLTRTSTRSSAVATASRALASRTSATWNVAEGPILDVAAFRLAALRLTTTTLAPCLAKADAMAKPIPVAPPVTTTVFAENRSVRNGDGAEGRAGRVEGDDAERDDPEGDDPEGAEPEAREPEREDAGRPATTARSPLSALRLPSPGPTVASSIKPENSP
jgi:hypothetical protein